jgi:hypothetical protein
MKDHTNQCAVTEAGKCTCDMPAAIEARDLFLQKLDHIVVINDLKERLRFTARLLWITNAAWVITIGLLVWRNA